MKDRRSHLMATGPSVEDRIEKECDSRNHIMFLYLTAVEPEITKKPTRYLAQMSHY